MPSVSLEESLMILQLKHWPFSVVNNNVLPKLSTKMKTRPLPQRRSAPWLLLKWRKQQEHILAVRLGKLLLLCLPISTTFTHSAKQQKMQELFVFSELSLSQPLLLLHRGSIRRKGKLSTMSLSLILEVKLLIFPFWPLKKESLKWSQLQETLTWEEKILTTEWLIILSMFSRESTRITSKVTREFWEGCGQRAREKREYSAFAQANIEIDSLLEGIDFCVHQHFQS